VFFPHFFFDPKIVFDGEFFYSFFFLFVTHFQGDAIKGFNEGTKSTLTLITASTTKIFYCIFSGAVNVILEFLGLIRDGN
jgi:hypothetical protein